MDPFLLHKSASLAASFAYSLANLEPKDVPSILGKALELASRDMARIGAEATEKKREAGNSFEELEHYARFHKETCRDLKRFFDQDEYQKELEAMVEDSCSLIDQQMELAFKSYLKVTDQEDYKMCIRDRYHPGQK